MGMASACALSCLGGDNRRVNGPTLRLEKSYGWFAPVYFFYLLSLYGFWFCFKLAELLGMVIANTLLEVLWNAWFGFSLSLLLLTVLDRGGFITNLCRMGDILPLTLSLEFTHLPYNLLEMLASLETSAVFLLPQSTRWFLPPDFVTCRSVNFGVLPSDLAAEFTIVLLVLILYIDCKGMLANLGRTAVVCPILLLF